MAAFWREIAEDHSVRVVVLTGAGDQAFSSGGDMGSLIPLMMRTRAPCDEWEERFAADRRQLNAALLRNASFFKPVIAAINGHAHAGGAEFVLSTDLRVMSSAATLAVRLVAAEKLAVVAGPLIQVMFVAACIAEMLDAWRLGAQSTLIGPEPLSVLGRSVEDWSSHT